MTPALNWTKLHTTVLAISMAGLATGCRTNTDTAWHTPTYYGGSYAEADDTSHSIARQRVDTTDTDPGRPGGDRTSADPSETSTLGAGSRALVGAEGDRFAVADEADVIVTIGPGARQQLAEQDLQREDMEAVGGATLEDEGAMIDDQSSSQTFQSGMTSTNLVIPLHQEQVHVGTRVEDAGTIRLKKIVRTETVNKPVQIRTETVTIDREPASGSGAAFDETTERDSFSQQQTSPGQAFQEQEFTIRLQREVPVVQTQVVPSGQVVAQTRVQTQQTNIQTQIRREDISVEDQGAANANISNNLRSEGTQSDAGTFGEDQSAVGAANERAGQISGAASSAAGAAITELSAMEDAQNLSTMAGRQVRLSKVKVDAVVGPQLISIGTAGERPILVRLQQPMPNLKEGDEINLTGTIRQAAQANTQGLNGDASHVLSQQQVYVEAQTATPAQE
jgi:stress response protein YsnF